MGAREAGTHLRGLLVRPGRIRDTWSRLGPAGPDQVSFAAITRVIERHLWDIGEDDGTGPRARTLKDRVRRALTGETLSVGTLGWFIGAFDIAPDEARRLTSLLDGSAGVHVLFGTALERRVVLPRPTRTVALNEHHYLGADRMPVQHVTTQVLEATADRVDRYVYMFDTAALTVDVLHGGDVRGPVFEVGDGVFGLEIMLTRPLTAGETTTLTYQSTFFYEQPPPPEFRRAAFFPVDAVDLRVQFDPRALPAEVRYAEWPSLGDPASFTRAHPLEADGSVHVFLRAIENVIIGFTWDWPAE